MHNRFLKAKHRDLSKLTATDLIVYEKKIQPNAISILESARSFIRMSDLVESAKVGEISETDGSEK